MKKYDVLVVGDVNLDLMMVGFKRLPLPGEEINAKHAFQALGGGCAITAAGLAKMGLSVAIYGFVGNDTIGRNLIAELEDAGVSTEYLSVDDSIGTGISVSLTNREDRAFLSYTGANSLYDAAKIPDHVLESAGHVHAVCYSKRVHDKYVKLFKRIKSAGATISLDVGYDESEEWSQNIYEATVYTDIFMPNNKEAKAYTRTASADDAIKALVEHCNIAIVKNGPRGSLAAKDDQVVNVAGFEADCVDTTGAGDSFNAGFIYGFVKGYDLEQCLQIGNAMGAQSVQDYGGTRGVPKRDDIRAFLESKAINILR